MQVLNNISPPLNNYITLLSKLYKKLSLTADIDPKDSTKATITVTYNRELVKGEEAKAVTLTPEGNGEVGEAKIDKVVYTYEVTKLSNNTAKDITLKVMVGEKDSEKTIVIPASQKAIDTEKLNADKALLEELTIEIPKETTEQDAKTQHVQTEVDNAIKNGSKAKVTFESNKYKVELTNGEAEKVNFELNNVTDKE